jgi:enoyl-CoA hydratase/carnithine racemase
MAHVVAEVRPDGIMVITLNRPTAGNALGPDAFQQWQAIVARAATDDAVKAVVVTGSGKFFSTGADVRAIAGKVMEDPDCMADVLRGGSAKLCTMLIDCPKLTVAAVNGPVVGFPAGLLGVFDTVYVSSTATYSMPFLHLGIVPEGASSYTLPATAGRAVAKDVLLHGRVLSADEMVRHGIAARKLDCTDDAFRAAAVELVASGVAKAAFSSIVEAKRLIGAEIKERMHAANRAETDTVISQFAKGVPIKRFAAVAGSIGKKKSKL